MSENTSNNALNTLKDNKEILQNVLRQQTALVTFVKKDGSTRKMVCTLKEGVAIPHEKKTDRVKTVADNILPVWDVEAGGWRSVNVETLQSIDIMLNVNLEEQSGADS